MKTNLKLSLSMVFVLSHLLFGCGGKEETKQESIRPVKAVRIETADMLTKKDYPGVTQESREVDLSFRVSGPLTQLNIEDGQKVRKGQLIAAIDSRDYVVELDKLKARLMQAQSEKERYEKLLEKKAVSRNEYEKKLADYLSAKAAVKSAQNALADTKIYAPFEGFINKKLVENYEEVKAKQAIANLIDLSVIEVKLTIPENLAVKAKSFESYSVKFDMYPDTVFTATFKEIGKKTEGGSESIPLTLFLNHKNTKKGDYPVAPGFSCKVNIKLKGEETADDEPKAFSIPLSAIFEAPDAKGTSVWVFNPDQGVVEKRDVSLGGFASKDNVNIISGLKEGEWVVTAGVSRITDGQKVKLLGN